MRAVPADNTTKTRRFAEAGVPAGGLALVRAANALAPVAAPGWGSPHQHLTSEVAVDTLTRRPGASFFSQGSVACMAAEPKPVSLLRRRQWWIPPPADSDAKCPTKLSSLRQRRLDPDG